MGEQLIDVREQVRQPGLRPRRHPPDAQCVGCVVVLLGELLVDAVGIVQVVGADHTPLPLEHLLRWRDQPIGQLGDVQQDPRRRGREVGTLRQLGTTEQSGEHVSGRVDLRRRHRRERLCGLRGTPARRGSDHLGVQLGQRLDCRTQPRSRPGELLHRLRILLLRGIGPQILQMPQECPVDMDPTIEVLPRRCQLRPQRGEVVDPGHVPFGLDDHPTHVRRIGARQRQCVFRRFDSRIQATARRLRLHDRDDGLVLVLQRSIGGDQQQRDRRAVDVDLQGRTVGGERLIEHPDQMRCRLPACGRVGVVHGKIRVRLVVAKEVVQHVTGDVCVLVCRPVRRHCCRGTGHLGENRTARRAEVAVQTR